MNTVIRFLAVACIALSTHRAHAAFGYINYSFSSGSTLFTSQLDSPPNNLTTLFSGATIPDGTTISLWDPATLGFNLGSTFSSGAWSFNLTLQAGQGYRLNTSAAFINTFVGTILNHDGSVLTGSLTPPPVYAGPNGIYLLADKSPLADTGIDIFLNILGRQPNAGEQVITLSSTSTYLGGGNWSGGVPTLNVGDAALLNIGPVPEPSTVALGLLGIVLSYFCRRRRL